jgi:putative membrane protein
MRRHAIGFLQGIIIGAGAILPGISGAALAVVFGVYEDFMDLIAHPVKNLRSFLEIRASLCVGIAVGFVSFTLLLDKLFSAHEIFFVFLFTGFIAGTIPDIWNRARKHGVGAKEILAFALSAGLLIAFAVANHASGMGLAASAAQAPAHNAAATGANPGIAGLAVFFAAGAIIGAGSLLPGISASFILIYLGLYAPLLDAAAHLELPVGIAIGLGAIVAVIGFSRLVNRLYHRHHGVVSFTVLGFTLGSLILVFPGLPETPKIIPCAMLAIAGFAGSYFLARSQS